jgi:phenylalanyl-tRNA synthetase beta chain
VLDFIASLGQDLISRVEIFDVYKGPPIPDGKKSMAFRFTYQSFERNVTDTEVNSIHESVINKVLKEFDATLPAK